MFGRSLSWFILVFTLLEFVAKTQLTTYDSSHGFINNNHDRYLAKEISSIQDELTDIRGVMINSKLNSKLQIKFNPEILDFKQRHLGVPHLEKVMLFNIDSNYSVDMTSISGSTVHFHSSFFENKKIPPLGNTTFNVVFLGREEGSVESNLFIHTTQGHFKYRVKGDSVFSPYRLRPIVNVRLPPNASFAPVIHFHNPFQEAVQIVEIYCSGGDFHLELPSGEMEGPKDMWEVAPFETKAIIRVRFVGEAARNHTSYVRIKLNNSEEALVVPLEIQVTPEAMPYAPQGYVDFGVGGSEEAARAQRLTLCNPFKKAVRVAAIHTASASVSVELLEEGRVIPAGKDEDARCVEVAKLVFDWKTAYENKDFFGKLVVKYKNANRRTEVAYHATVIEGGFTFNASQTNYFIHAGNAKEKPENRRITIKNDFETPVKLLNVTLPPEARLYFQVTDFKPHVLKRAEERAVFALKFNAGVQWTHMKLNTFIRLHTNISSLHFPLVSYDGKLDLKLPHKSKDNSLDLGLISVESKKETYILVINKNPIAVDIRQVTTSIPSGQVELLGCGKGGHEEALLQESYANMTKCDRLRSKEHAVLKLSVRSGRSETQIWGDISVNTQYEQLSIPVHFKIASGRLEIGPDRLVFDQCFPYKICSHPLRIHSSFDHPMVIEDILSIPPDERVTCKHSGHILGRATKVVGALHLDPNKRCDQECYLGIQDAETRVYWRKSIALPPTSTCDLDLNLVNILYHRYLNETAHGASPWQNITMRMDTSEVKGHLFRTRVKMSWPTLVVNETFENKSAVNFPLTQVGNTTYKNVTIRNPASYDLLVQIVIDAFYPHFDVLFEGLPPVFVAYTHDSFVRGTHGFFLERSAAGGELDERFPAANKNSLTVQLRPNEEITFRVGFKAIDSSPNVGFLVVRNNLTIVEMVQLSGRGALPHFKFGNRKPGGSQQPLLFEFGEKHLKDCDLAAKSKSGSIPIISLKRSFTAKNNGEIPIFINSFYVNQLPCEGYGFKILNCEPTILLPNGTKKIDIEFTPDYTLAKVTRTLVLDTSLNFPVNYTLVTTIPSYYLSACSSAIERPEWEHNMYVLTSIIMVFALTIALLVAVMDSDKICLEAVYLLFPQNNVQHTLDLRSIGAQTRQELQAAKAEAETQSKANDNVLKQDDKGGGGAKADAEKYTAVVPTTGKAKKKNRKLSDQQERDREQHKKQWMEAQRLKHEEQIATSKHAQEEVGSKKHPKKHATAAGGPPKKLDAGRNGAMPAAPAASEEETSSTTTESSHSNLSSSNEEKKTKKQPVQPVKPVESNPASVQDKESGYGKAHGQREKTGKAKHKYLQSEKQSAHVTSAEKEVEKVPTEKVIIEKVKPNRRERREREKNAVAPQKGQNGEKPHKNSDKEKDSFGANRISPCAQLMQGYIQSPLQPQVVEGSKPVSPVPSSVWNENKASFSDVVGRSETPATATPSPGIGTKTTSTTKPTMYVEPYKQQAYVPASSQAQAQQQAYSHHTHSPKLAPIGSRGRWSDNHPDYARLFNDAMVSTNLFLDVESPHHMHPPSQPATHAHSQPPQPNLPTNSHSSNPWLMNSPHPSTPWENPSYGGQSHNETSNYLWGSAVWEPWTPPAVQDAWSPSVLRTPPGFAPQRLSQEDDLAARREVRQSQVPPQMQVQQAQQQMERNGTFNPFGYRNIWTAQVQHTDPWLPRGQ